MFLCDQRIEPESLKKPAAVALGQRFLSIARMDVGQECLHMYIRQIVIAVLLCLLPSCFATAEEPVVRGSFHTILILGHNCLTVPQAEPRLRPGTRLEMRSCEDNADQIFEWNVDTFEIKFHDLCVDAFRVGEGRSQPGDPIGLWYCQKTKHQKWFPRQKNESWLDAFNIVGGGSPSSDLCLNIAGNKDVDGAQLTIQNCNGGDNQWFRLYPWPPLNSEPVARRENSISLIAALAANAARMIRLNKSEAAGR
jgi:hypothetical protein